MKVLSGLVVLTMLATGWQGASSAAPSAAKSTEQRGEKTQASPDRKPDAGEKSAKSSSDESASEPREAIAIRFAKQHHPELLALVEPLKKSNPKEYLKAVRELSRAAERIDAIKDTKRQKLELESWKANSQIRLLSARLSMDPAVDVEAQLKAALTHQREIRLELTEHELQQLHQRQERLTAELTRLKTDPEQQIEREYQVLLKRLQRPMANTKSQSDKKKTDKKPDKSDKATPAAKPAIKNPDKPRA